MLAAPKTYTTHIPYREGPKWCAAAAREGPKWCAPAISELANSDSPANFGTRLDCQLGTRRS
eukprot:3573063-Rhodomonas_salina.1